jgi:hypothetical protein
MAAGALIGTAISVAAYAIESAVTQQEMTFSGVAEAAVSGAVSGALMGIAGPAANVAVGVGARLVSSTIARSVAGRVVADVVVSVASNVIADEAGNLAGKAGALIETRPDAGNAPPGLDVLKDMAGGVADGAIASPILKDLEPDSAMLDRVVRGSNRSAESLARRVAWNRSLLRTRLTAGAVVSVVSGVVYETIRERVTGGPN